MPQFEARLKFPGGKTLEFHGPADLTKETTEAIVNAANSYLIGGGGVDGAIHNAGGPSILQECKRITAKIGQLPPGKAVITGAGRLPTQYVIHTVGPIYRGGKAHEAQTLASCYRESISLADDHGIRSLAFPSISTGVYGYPVNKAAPVAVEAIIDALPKMIAVQQVRLVLFHAEDCTTYIRAAEALLQQRPEISAIFEKGAS
jgi:O-acetyl-ADP-ribose deacetylase (regulator of RNase III)